MKSEAQGPSARPDKLPDKRPYKKNTVAILLLLSYLCLTAGQVSAKMAGMVLSSKQVISGIPAPQLALAFAFGTYFFFLLRGLLWVFLLRKLKLVLAYPLMSIGYILVLVVSFLFFNETVTVGKIVGALLLMSGVILVAYGEVRQKKAAEKSGEEGSLV
jgi:drug/metabolite transporter (DMT)-like permease